MAASAKPSGSTESKKKAEPIQIMFAVERDTKNKVRFQEVEAGERQPGDPVPKDKAVMEKIYVSKKSLKRLGEPGMVRVTLEAVS